jgi:hypothetical protein
MGGAGGGGVTVGVAAAVGEGVGVGEDVALVALADLGAVEFCDDGAESGSSSSSGSAELSEASCGTILNSDKGIAAAPAAPFIGGDDVGAGDAVSGGVADAVADGSAVGVGDAVGDGVAVGAGVGAGVAVGVADGDGVSAGDGGAVGVAIGVGKGLGAGDGFCNGLATGVAIGGGAAVGAAAREAVGVGGGASAGPICCSVIGAEAARGCDESGLADDSFAAAGGGSGLCGTCASGPGGPSCEPSSGAATVGGWAARVARLFAYATAVASSVPPREFERAGTTTIASAPIAHAF